jgi:hypothetical protein
MYLLLASLLLIAVPADEIKADLKSAKYTPGFEGGGDLLGFNENEDKAFFYINGTVDLTVKVPAAGEYTLTVKASCQAAKKENAKINIVAGGKSVADEFTLKSEEEKEYTFTVNFKAAGEQKVSIAYTNDEYKDGEYDRNLYLHAVTLKKKEAK